jgi:phosphoenolpyruvate-protein kinase (PTS system EI component)
MSIAITTTLSSAKYDFLTSYAKRMKKPKNAILEAWLALLERESLEEQIAKGFSSRKEEYKEAVKDFYPAQISSLHD